MEVLISVLKHVPDNPMEPEWITVQSKGMKQWIAAQTAQGLGICANMNFIFPRQVIDHILTGVKPLSNHNMSNHNVANHNMANHNMSNHNIANKNQINKDLANHDLDEDFFFWAAMKIISENRSNSGFSNLENYIKEDKTGIKLYQLSLKIAKIFDDYQVYRPFMVMDWQRQNRHKSLKDPVVKWQAELFNKIVSQNLEDHFAFKACSFLEQFSGENFGFDHLPKRISFFGISSMPEIFLHVLEKTSQFIDINFFILTPSNQFFFDIKSQKQMGQIALKQKDSINSQDLYYEMTNPLLASLGTAGKNFHLSLESIDYHEPFDDLFSDPMYEPENTHSILTFIQSDILNLVHRKKGQENPHVKIKSSDTSIALHACHSPMRETQVLKDLLLYEFEKDPKLAPHDIIVMMPNIEDYAPFIESVFSQEYRLPFSISDRKKRSESEPIEAFFKILALRKSRFERSEVLDLLLSESIAQKFKISFDEISMIEKMVQESNILWGMDKEHRKNLNLPAFEENTWHFGLQRLFMGMAMPMPKDKEDREDREDREDQENTTVQDIMPCHVFEGLDLEVLGRFAAFSDTLFSSLKVFQENKTVEKWCKALKNICISLMESNSKNREDITFLFTIISKLKENSIKFGLLEKVSFDFVFSILEQKLDQSISHGNFLSGNITFCNIMPMRSIPFKIVVLMGMSEDSFPRQISVPGFDLIKKNPRPCDKIERDEDRYLFLETLICARSKFIITYTGLSIHDDSRLPCSGVVNELMDVMAQSFIFKETYIYHFFHPLHPFNQEYFLKDQNCFSFSKDNCSIAKTLSKKKSQPVPFISESFRKEIKSKKLDEKVSQVPLEDLIYFFKNPVQWYVKQGLNIKIPDLKEPGLDRETFSISGLDQYNMGSFLVEKQLKLIKDERDYYSIFKAKGSLPFGKKGQLEYENITNIAAPVIDAAKNIALKKQLPDILGEVKIEPEEIKPEGVKSKKIKPEEIKPEKTNPEKVNPEKVNPEEVNPEEVNPEKINIDTMKIRVFANLSDITEQGIYYLTYGKINGARLLSAWIRHLFLNLTAPDDYPKNTIVTGRNPQKKEELLEYQFVPLESKAESCFNDLLKIYLNAQTQIFYFACETSWQIAQILKKNSFDFDQDTVFKILNNYKVRNAWYGGSYQTGEKENPYISLSLKNNDPFEDSGSALAYAFVENSVNVYKPLLENMALKL